MAASSRTTPASAAALERRELAELFKTGIDLCARERAEAFHAKSFAAEAAHDGPVNHGPAEHAAADMIALQAEAMLGQVADEAARETVAGAGGIEDVFEQVSGHYKERVAPEQHGAILAALDHHGGRAHVQNLARGLAQVGLAREHARFVIVDQQKVPVLDGLKQIFPEIAYPEVHSIAAGQAQVLHLVADAALQAGLDVPQQQVAGVLVALR